MEVGTCIWFKNSYGFIGRGMFTNNSYEGQIYCHWKNIVRKGLRNPKYRELAPGDVVEFTEGTGFFTDGSQAINVKVVTLAEIDDERLPIQDINKEDAEVDVAGLSQVDGQGDNQASEQL